MCLTEEVPADNHDSWFESEREFQEEIESLSAVVVLTDEAR